MNIDTILQIHEAISTLWEIRAYVAQHGGVFNPVTQTLSVRLGHTLFVVPWSDIRLSHAFFVTPLATVRFDDDPTEYVATEMRYRRDISAYVANQSAAYYRYRVTMSLLQRPGDATNYVVLRSYLRAKFRTIYWKDYVEGHRWFQTPPVRLLGCHYAPAEDRTPQEGLLDLDFYVQDMPDLDRPGPASDIVPSDRDRRSLVVTRRYP